jgi:hypothetical protein
MIFKSGIIHMYMWEVSILCHVKYMKEGGVQMYTVTHIYEADFGCEERADGAKAKCVVYLEDENGRQRHVEVEDEWLTANGIEEGSSWKENITDEA